MYISLQALLKEKWLLSLEPEDIFKVQNLIHRKERQHRFKVP